MVTYWLESGDGYAGVMSGLHLLSVPPIPLQDSRFLFSALAETYHCFWVATEPID
jgi:hypothetical protein